MSEERDQDEPTHGATTIRASKGGGAGKWLLGGLAAVVLAGGGYAAWKASDSDRTNIDTAYNDTYSGEPLRAGPLASDDDTLAESASTDENAAPPASTETRRPASTRRSTARAAPIPEETIGITPVNVTTEDSATSDSDEIVVTAPPRPIWARTPSERRLSALYPARALERGREGEARLHCTVLDGGALDCARASETESTFGTAAMRVSRTLRHAPQRADGSDATGTPVNLRVVFRIEDEPRRG